jgi:hypothetical protein
MYAAENVDSVHQTRQERAAQDVFAVSGSLQDFDSPLIGQRLLISREENSRPRILKGCRRQEMMGSCRSLLKPTAVWHRSVCCRRIRMYTKSRASTCQNDPIAARREDLRHPHGLRIPRCDWLAPGGLQLRLRQDIVLVALTAASCWMRCWLQIFSERTY